jgi:hypothetical protein
LPAPNLIVIVSGSLLVTSGLVAWEMHTSSLQVAVVLDLCAAS